MTFYPYLAEFIGTAMLVALGLGTNASNSLEGSLFKGAGPVYVMMGWGLAVMLPAMAFGAQSAAHYNPVLTLGLAIAGLFSWKLVFGYMVAQMLGGIVGACLMWVVFRDQFDLTEKTFKEESIGTNRGVFCTGPGIDNPVQNLIGELMATFFLVFFITTIPSMAGSIGLNYFFVNCIIMSCGFSYGATTGFAMNPARDTAPRIAYAILPFHYKDPNWKYAWIPIVGPLIGSILGALLGSYVATFPLLEEVLQLLG